MATRPYFSYTGSELSALFEKSKTDKALVNTIYAELKHRKTPSAVALREKIDKFLKEGKSGNSSKGGTSQSEREDHDHLVTCKICNTRMRVPKKEARISYRCPGCKALFEVDIVGSLIEVTFFREETNTEEDHDDDQSCNFSVDRAYEILGLKPGTEYSEIKAAWRKLSQQYHPDKHQGLPDRLRLAAESEMAKINLAFKLLSKLSAEEF